MNNPKYIAKEYIKFKEIKEFIVRLDKSVSNNIKTKVVINADL
tara:strand:+ start:872 stop:1000 length:129 start_codon:yes stop_codon:yes gene_type:complete